MINKLVKHLESEISEVDQGDAEAKVKRRGEKRKGREGEKEEEEGGEGEVK